MLARVTDKKQPMKPEPEPWLPALSQEMTWVMPSRLQTKLTSSEALRGTTGWGEPVARQPSGTPPLTAAPSCSGDTGVLICITHEGRRDGGDLNQVVTLSSWQPLPWARPAGRACGVRYHRGLAGAPYSPPFRPALFQPISLLSKPTPRHSDHISKVPLDLARARLLCHSH